MRAHLLFGIGFLLVLTATAAAGPPAAAEPAKKVDEAEALFRSAFEQHLTPDRRVHVLERVVKEHSDSPWADDALWVLGEAARRQQLTLRVVYYWQFLVARWPAVHLEEYTRSLEFYRSSPVGGITHLLEMKGVLYARRPGHIVPGKHASSFVYTNAVAFNPAPMLVWEELGDCYGKLGKQGLAAAAYAKAQEAAPVGGDLAVKFRERLGNKLKAAQAKALKSAPATKAAEAPAKQEAAKAQAEAPKEEPAAPAAAPAGAPTETAASD